MAHKALALGEGHSCAIRADDTIVCWGSNKHEQSDPPEGTFKAIAAGYNYNCAIRTDVTVVCWGDDTSGQVYPPAGNLALSLVDSFGCGIRTDETIVCWDPRLPPDGVQYLPDD